MCPDSRCLFLGWFLFWFRVCELVIPLTNKGAPRSAFYIIHDCPELSTGRYSQIRIEGIMNSSSEKWNPRHYTSNMKPWSQLMETYHHVAAQVNPADFIIDLVSVHSDGGATWMLLICEQRRQGWGCPHKLQKTYTFMMHDAFNVLKCVWLCRTCFFPEDWWYSFVKAPYLLSLRSLFFPCHTLPSHQIPSVWNMNQGMFEAIGCHLKIKEMSMFWENAELPISSKTSWESLHDHGVSNGW